MTAPTAAEVRIRPREHLLAFGFFVLLALAGMWPQAPFTQWGRVSDPVDYDDRYHAFAMWWERQALLASPSRVLDAPFFHPAAKSLTSADHVIAISAATLPLGWFGIHPMLAYRLSNMLVIAVAGWGMWWLVARTTGDRWAALLAGIVWAANPHSFLELNRINVMTAPAWAPLAAMLIDDDQEPRARHLAAALACLVFCAWTGWYMTLFTVVFMACWCIASFAARRGRFAGRSARLATLGLATALSFVPLWLAYRSSSDTVYFHGDLAARNRFFPWNLVVPGPATFPGQLLARFGIHAGEKANEYAGVAVLIVAAAVAIALLSRRLRPRLVAPLADARLRTLVAFAVLLVAAGCAFGLGPRFHVAGRDVWLPFAWLGWVVDALKFPRWPGRFGMLAMFGVAVLAGVALALLRAAFPAVSGGTRGRIAAAALCLVAFLDILAMPGKARKEIPASPVLDRLASRDEIRVVAEVPVRDMVDVTEAMLSATRHRKAIPHGYSDIGFGPPNLDELFGLWPAAPARAAMQMRGIDALLLVHDRMEQPPPSTMPDGWRELDRDAQFTLVAPDGELPDAATRLLADLEPPESVPEPMRFDGSDLLGRLWRDRMHMEGDVFVAGVDAVTAIRFDPPIDTRVHRRVTIRMRLLSGPASPEATRIFWTGATFPDANERRASQAPVPVDGEWHDVAFDFSRDPRWVWCGEVSQIRWDPTHNSNYRFQVQSITIH